MIIDIRFFFLKKDTSTRVQIINQKMKSLLIENYISAYCTKER